MRIDIITVHPELIESPFQHSIVKRGISKGLIVMAEGEEESWKQLVNSFEITMRYYLSEEEVEAIKEKANVLSSADR